MAVRLTPSASALCPVSDCSTPLRRPHSRAISFRPSLQAKRTLLAHGPKSPMQPHHLMSSPAQQTPTRPTRPGWARLTRAATSRAGRHAPPRSLNLTLQQCRLRQWKRQVCPARRFTRLWPTRIQTSHLPLYRKSAMQRRPPGHTFRRSLMSARPSDRGRAPSASRARQMRRPTRLAAPRLWNSASRLPPLRLNLAWIRKGPQP